MANNASAKKRNRQTLAATQRNRIIKSRIRTYRKRFLAAVDSGDSAKAQEAYNSFISVAERAAKSNVIHKNTVSRLKSRSAARLKVVSA
jgi:small subunit ribosomal protein S20